MNPLKVLQFIFYNIDIKLSVIDKCKYYLLSLNCIKTS